MTDTQRANRHYTHTLKTTGTGSTETRHAYRRLAAVRRRAQREQRRQSSATAHTQREYTQSAAS